MYIEDRDTRECTVSDLKDTFRPIHIPANATFEAEFFLGTSGIAGAGVLVEAWTGKTTNPNGVQVNFIFLLNFIQFQFQVITTSLSQRKGVL